MFKSAKQPLLLTFKTDSDKDYTVTSAGSTTAIGRGPRADACPYRLNLCTRRAQILFKQGDDVRQDQLVLNIIQLMDRLLKKEKLDLQLTSYKVLATAPSQGMIEFIQAEPLAKILAENNNDLQAFLRKHNRDDNADYQIAPAVMDTYVKSCGAPLPARVRWRIPCPDRCR